MYIGIVCITVKCAVTMLPPLCKLVWAFMGRNISHNRVMLLLYYMLICIHLIYNIVHIQFVYSYIHIRILTITYILINYPINRYPHRHCCCCIVEDTCHISCRGYCIKAIYLYTYSTGQV